MASSSIRRSLLEDNRAGTLGGAIYAAELELEDTQIVGNSADAGGGIFIDANADYTSSPLSVTLTDTTVEDNVSHSNGGGMYVLSGSDVVVNGGTFTGNVAALDVPKKNYVAAGGAIVAAAGDESGTITLANMTIDNNDADYGGGIMVNESDGTQATVFLENVLVRNNRAAYGAGLFAFNDQPDFPALVSADAATLFDENTATSGGGGALVFGANGGAVRLEGGTFTNGASGFYSGGLFLYTEAAGTVVVDGVSMSENYGGSGGDVTIEGTGITLKHATLSNSSADSYGGSIFVTSADDVRLESIVIDSSECSELGGAIALFSSTSVFLSEVTMIGTSAQQNGGAVYAAFSTATMIGVEILGRGSRTSTAAACTSTAATSPSPTRTVEASSAGGGGGGLLGPRLERRRDESPGRRELQPLRRRARGRNGIHLHAHQLGDHVQHRHVRHRGGRLRRRDLDAHLDLGRLGHVESRRQHPGRPLRRRHGVRGHRCGCDLHV